MGAEAAICEPTAAGGRLTEDSGQLTEDSGQLTEDSGRLTEDSGRLTEDSGQLTEDGGRLTEDSGQLTEDGGRLTAAQRARMERQRLRARALHDARLLRRPPEASGACAAPLPGGVIDTGGGFLLPAGGGAGAGEGQGGGGRVVAPPAPLPHRSQQPPCLVCARPVPHSFLLDTFDHPVCDQCRDEEGEHALVPRTEAKAEFLLKDADLDAREPPLRALRRRNPHRGGADMRLYLRAQLSERALLVWGSAAALRDERLRRERARARAADARAARRLRALRLAARSSQYARAPPHRHHYGPERRAARDHDDDHDDDDVYERECTTCGHLDRYEKL